MWKPIALQVEKVLLYIWRVACSGAPQRTSIRNEGARSLMFRVSFSPLKFSCTAALKALEAPKGSFGSQFRYDYLKSPLERDTVPKCTVPNILCIYHIYIHSIYIYIYTYFLSWTVLFAVSSLVFAVCRECPLFACSFVLQVHRLGLFGQAGCRSTLRSWSLGAETLMLRRLNQCVNRKSNAEKRGAQLYCMDCAVCAVWGADKAKKQTRTRHSP